MVSIPPNSFPLISAIQLYHTQPSHLASVLSMAWFEIVMQPFIYNHGISIQRVTFLVCMYSTVYHSKIWQAPLAAKMKQILYCIPGRNTLSCPLGITHVSRSHVINRSLTKLVWLRWLDIGLIFFFCMCNLWTRSFQFLMKCSSGTPLM